MKIHVSLIVATRRDFIVSKSVRALALLALLVTSFAAFSRAVNAQGNEGILRDIRQTVTSNYGQIRDIQYSASMYLHYFQADNALRSDHVRAFTEDGLEYWSKTRNLPIDAAPPPSDRWYRYAYDGNDLRIQTPPLNHRDGHREGSIYPGHDNHQLRRKANIELRVDRVWGFYVLGKSLPEWLADPNTRVIGEETIDGVSTVVVRGVYRDSGGTFHVDYYLSKEFNYAPVRLETSRNGNRINTMTCSDFREVRPGFWLPFRGHNTPIDFPSGRKSGSESFVVKDVLINSGLDRKLFTIEFNRGDFVTDYRDGPPGKEVIYGESANDGALTDQESSRDRLRGF